MTHIWNRSDKEAVDLKIRLDKNAWKTSYCNKAGRDQEKIDEVSIFLWGMIFLNISNSEITIQIRRRQKLCSYTSINFINNWKEKVPTTMKFVKRVQIYNKVSIRRSKRDVKWKIVKINTYIVMTEKSFRSQHDKFTTDYSKRKSSSDCQDRNHIVSSKGRDWMKPLFKLHCMCWENKIWIKFIKYNFDFR